VQNAVSYFQLFVLSKEENSQNLDFPVLKVDVFPVKSIKSLFTERILHFFVLTLIKIKMIENFN